MFLSRWRGLHQDEEVEVCGGEGDEVGRPRFLQCFSHVPEFVRGLVYRWVFLYP